MRVCFVSHTAEKGGAERALLELLDALAARGVEPHVIVPRHGPLVEELAQRGVSYSIAWFDWWLGPVVGLRRRVVSVGKTLAGTLTLARAMRRVRPDVVVSNTLAIGVGALAARLLRLPHVWYIHEFGYADHRLRFRLGARLSWWVVDRCARVCVVNSVAVRRHVLARVTRPKVKLAYYSVTLPGANGHGAARRARAGGIRCAIVGRLHEGKRQEDAIRAVAVLRREGVAAELVVVGDGDAGYRRALEQLAVAEQVRPHVTFVGQVDDPFRYMREADVVLMCSRAEAFGRVTVEAMKLGVPVIGARSGATPELVRDGFNGFLYECADYRQLAERIRPLSRDPALRAALGQNARMWATERFTPERYSRRLLGILEEVTANSRGQGRYKEAVSGR